MVGLFCCLCHRVIVYNIFIIIIVIVIKLKLNTILRKMLKFAFKALKYSRSIQKRFPPIKDAKIVLTIQERKLTSENERKEA